MNKIAAILFADHHAGGGYPSRGIDDSQYSLSQIITAAIENKVEWVISLGDVVDSLKCHADAPVRLRNSLRTLTVRGIHFGYVDGNHDKRNVSWLDYPAFTPLQGEVLKLGGRMWTGLDYHPRGEIQEKLANLRPGVTGLFMHQGWSDVMGWDTAQCEFADVPGQVSVVATGDYHGHAFIASKRGKDGQKILVVSPGSTSVQDVSETDEKYYAVMYEDGRFEFVRLKTRAVLRSDVLTTSNDFDKFIAEVGPRVEAARQLSADMGMPEELQRPLLQVRYSASLPDVVRRVTKIVGDRAHLFWKETPLEQLMSPMQPPVSASGLAWSPAAMLKEEINPDNPDDPLAKEKYELASQLVNVSSADEARSVVGKWRDKMMGG